MEYLAIFMAAVNLKYRTMMYVDLQLVVTKVTIFHVRRLPSFRLYTLRYDIFVDDFSATTCGTLQARLVASMRNSGFLVAESVAEGEKRKLYWTKKANKKIRRMANLGGACSLWTRGALVEDVPKTFSGVVTFAHECGHL
ncbi:unnamed protein product [Ixodes persulcatus]